MSVKEVGFTEYILHKTAGGTKIVDVLVARLDGATLQEQESAALVLGQLLAAARAVEEYSSQIQIFLDEKEILP
jgi:hypothetical protein